MTLYQLYTRLKHFFTAKHWHGAAIHSPMMYAFVREHALTHRGERLIEKIAVPTVDSVRDLCNVKSDIIILRQPFKSRAEKELFTKFYAENHVVIAHFQGLIVIFFDQKLQKQQYVIRN